jgi:hypothetical protein
MNLESLLIELEQDRSLQEPHRLRQRIEALDRLDVYCVDGQIPAAGFELIEASLYERARAIYAGLESANREIYETIRRDIRQGMGPVTLLRWMRELAQSATAAQPVRGEGYDDLDELVSGVLQFDNPSGPPDLSVEAIRLADEMVFYQPTPARHVFDLMERTALTERDVLIDFGSGLGHVPLLASICTGARSIGIELEPAYVECARRCAEALHLNNVRFIQQDARAADLSSGTVFYLYTPFTGSILRSVLDRLQQEAASREIRVCTFGPCTRMIAEETWLKTDEAPAPDRVAVFRSRN